MRKVFGGLLLGLCAAAAPGAPRDARFDLSADAAVQVTVPGFGTQGVAVSGTATLPAPGTGWWVAFEVFDPDGHPIEDYGVTVPSPHTQTYGWPAAATYNWTKTLYCVDSGNDAVDWPAGEWVVVCRLYAVIGAVTVEAAWDAVGVEVE